MNTRDGFSLFLVLLDVEWITQVKCGVTPPWPCAGALCGIIQFKRRKKSLTLATLTHPPLLCSLQAWAGPGDGCYNAMLHPQSSIPSPTH